MRTILIILAVFLAAASMGSAANSPPGTPVYSSGLISGDVGATYGYKYTASDPNGDSLKYTFDWGDGVIKTSSLRAPGSYPMMYHTWTAAGIYTVKARATDSSGATSGWSLPLTVNIGGTTPPVNAAPVTPSIPAGVNSGVSGTTYMYSASTTDPNGDQVKYTFNWGDGTSSTTSLINSGSSGSASHSWTVAAGQSQTFSVTVKATDALGLSSAASTAKSVTIAGPAIVNNPPATPSIPSGPTSGSSGTSYSYATAATDPDGNKVKYTFDWGDGTTSESGPVASGASFSSSHIWTVAAGASKTFAVKAKATDEGGLSSVWSSTRSVTITGPAIEPPSTNSAPAKPSIPEGSIVGYSGTNYKYSTKATDPDGDRVKYTFDWGDGTTSTTALVSSGTTATAAHTWTIAPGTKQTFNVAVKATDEHGLSGPSMVSTVIIVAQKENHPPTLPTKPVGPISGVTGVTYSYSSVSTDPDGDLIKYIFDFGDGSTETGYLPSGQKATVSHIWNKVPAGMTWTYTVRVFCADSKYLMNPAPYWSEGLVVSIRGPALAMASEPEEQMPFTMDGPNENDPAPEENKTVVEPVNLTAI